MLDNTQGILGKLHGKYVFQKGKVVGKVNRESFTLLIAIKISIYKEMEQMIIMKNSNSQTKENPTEN